jgi:hypothetical protein
MVNHSRAGKKRSASRSNARRPARADVRDVPRDTTYMEAEVIVFAREQTSAALNPPLPLCLLRLHAECARFSSRPSAYPTIRHPTQDRHQKDRMFIQAIPPVMQEQHTTTKSCACLRR